MGIIRTIKETTKSMTCEICCDYCGATYIRRVADKTGKQKFFYCGTECSRKDPKKCMWSDERKKNAKPMFGEDNPNFNNRWSDEQRQKASERMKQSFLDDPDKAYRLGATNRGKKFSKELIEKMHSHRSKESYSGRHPSEETRKMIGEKSKAKWTPEYKERHRKKCEELGYWIPQSEISEFKKYSKLSNWICDMTEYFNEDELKNHNLFGMFNKNNSKGYVRDHIVSRYVGFINEIPYKIIRHPCNMRYIKHSDNISKGFSDRKLLDFEVDYIIRCLINRIKNFSLEWFEQEECLDIIKKDLIKYERTIEQ